MESGTLSDGLRETLGLFDASGTPRTTPEVAAELGLGRRTTYARLERLVEENRLATKKVGASARVWWRPGSVSTAESVERHVEFEQLVDAVEEYAIFTTDTAGYVRTWNAGASTITGYDAEAVLGGHCSEFYTEDDRNAGVPGADLAAARAEDGIEEEGWRLRADGSRFWAHVTITPIRDDGDVTGYAKVVRDMTDERRTEAERELLYDTTRSIADAESFEAGLEAAMADICSVSDWEYAEAWIPSEDGRLQRADAEYYVEDLSGFAALSTEHRFEPGQGLPGRVYETGSLEWVSDLSEGSTDVYPRLDAALDADLVSSFGVPVVADGEVVAVLTFLMRESRTHDDRLVSLVSSVAAELGELVARRRAEERLRSQRELLSQVFETAPIGLSVFDADGEMLRANERMTDILGLSQESDQRYTAGDRAVLDAEGNPLPFERKPVGRALETGDPVSDQEVQFPEPDGRTRWLSINATPLTDDDETVSRVVTAVTDITRLKDQAAQLERQRDDLDSELQEVFGRIDDAFFALDEDWQFTHVNQQAAELLDRSIGEIIGENVWNCFPEAIGTTFQDQYEHAMAAQESVTFEEYFAPLDIWFEVSAYPSEGGLSVYFRNVTDRKRRERELKEYERIVETVSDGIYVLDGDGRFQLVNEAFVSMTRYDRAELLGRHASAVFGEEFEDVNERAATQFASGEREVAVFEEEIYAADGTATTVESRFSRFDVEGGTGRAGVVRDISERIEIQRELELYATIVETVPDGVYALDEDERFVLVNQAFCDLIGYDREALLGASPPLVNNERVNERANELERQMQTGVEGTGTLSFEIQTADGDSAPVEGHVRPYSHRDVSGRCGVVRDMSERVERERTLEQQREQLTALNNLNEVVREITEAVIEQSTRAEIERTVCEYLADSQSYLFAWIGDADPTTQTVNLRTEAGVEGYLDGMTISVDPDDERSDGPTGRAFRTGEVETTRDISTDDRYGPWRDAVDPYGFRSSAAIPIVHEGTVYGVLNVYAERPYAFEGQECEMVGQLGEIVGHAIAAVERKQALLSDEVVELAFQVDDFMAAMGIDEEMTGTLELEHTVAVDDGEFVIFGRGTPDAVGVIERMVEELPGYEHVSVREDGTRFDLRVSEPPVLSAIASLGGSVEEAVIEDGDYRLTLQLSPSTDIAEVIDTVLDSFPGATLLKRRQLSKPDAEDTQGHALTGALTDRQLAVLETAYHAGFFEWPRAASGETLAASLDVAPPTFHQHLRKAEQKVFDGVFSTVN